MGLFWDDPKPRVTRIEWQKVRTSLFSRGLNKKEIDLIEGFFYSSLNETGIKDAGIQENEISMMIEWLKLNRATHKMSDQKIAQVEDALRDRL
ncbi:MAG: hypothetical protein HZA81_01915 [Candidatus Taylorbacteria bacterium]|nr:hypothetical protein [Candidatus Taylorbacteria bacterium]